MTNKPTPPSGSRRRFLQQSAAAVGGACAMALGVGLYSRQARALPSQAIRPSSALVKKGFHSACVRCGLYLRDCPYDTFKLAGLNYTSHYCEDSFARYFSNSNIRNQENFIYFK